MILRIALLNLWQHKRRTFFLAVAIALVTALLLVMLGITEGMRRSLVEASTTLMSGHVNVAGFFKVTSGQAAPVVTRSSAVRDVIVREVPELTFIARRGRGMAKMVSETSSKWLGIGGINITEEQGLQRILRVKEGRLEDLAKPGALLLFEDQAADLEVRVGDALTLTAPTPRGVTNTIDVTVAVVARNMGMMSQFSSFMNEGTLRKLYQLNDETTGALQVYLPSAELDSVRAVEARLRDALARAGYQLMDEDPRAFFFKFENVQREAWVGQRLDITNWHDEVSFVAWTVDLMSALSFILAVVLLQVVGVGIMIVMWMAIRERTQEIGTLRAIGMQRRSVWWMFLIEGTALGLVSTVAGVALGLAISYSLNAATVPLPLTLQFVLLSEKLLIVPTAQWIIATTVFITSAVTVFAFVPSIIAARLRPVTAMAHVN